MNLRTLSCECLHRLCQHAASGVILYEHCTTGLSASQMVVCACVHGWFYSLCPTDPTALSVCLLTRELCFRKHTEYSRYCVYGTHTHTNTHTQTTHTTYTHTHTHTHTTHAHTHTHTHTVYTISSIIESNVSVI